MPAERTRSELEQLLLVAFPDSPADAIAPADARSFLLELIASEWNRADDGVPSAGNPGNPGTGGNATHRRVYPVTNSNTFTAILPTGALEVLFVWATSPSAYGYEAEPHPIGDTVWSYNPSTRALTIPAYHLASGDTVTVLYGTGASGGGGNAVIQLS